MQGFSKTLFSLAIAIALAMATPSGLIHGQASTHPTGLVHAKKPVPSQYIVVLKEQETGPALQAAEIARSAHELSGQYSGELGFTYEHALHGFSIRMTEERALALSKDPRVAYVEEDGMVTIDSTEFNAPWGLDRIDRRLGLNGTYDFVNTGAGVHAYVIDTGILIAHQDFGGRASVIADFVGDGRNGNDCNGHGTHVAGILGGTTYGVAKGVMLHSVRVIGCSGPGAVSALIAGINWITSSRALPAVANISLGADPSPSLDSAVQNSIASGITYVVSAGNEATDASNNSPARVAQAITVGATDNTDSRPTYSNYGPLVDVFAPGDNITSDWWTSTTATNTIAGTSMAAPHVAGAAALYLQTHPSASPATVSSAITSQATKNVVLNPGPGSPNALLYLTFPPPVTITIAGQEQHACKLDVNDVCGGTIWDSGWVSATVNGRTYTASYGHFSTPASIASALAASINSDPDVAASVSGTVISLTSRFGCYTLSADYNTTLPNYFNPSFSATASPGPVCP